MTQASRDEAELRARIRAATPEEQRGIAHAAVRWALAQIPATEVHDMVLGALENDIYEDAGVDTEVDDARRAAQAAVASASDPATAAAHARDAAAWEAANAGLNDDYAAAAVYAVQYAREVAGQVALRAIWMAAKPLPDEPVTSSPPAQHTLKLVTRR